ncbi:MAG: hypothetical protein KAI47_03310 [Deltaproteobacteria bacterium]|nr:hypothetical protein [Deltaproteobacteria bacterium]
MALKNLLAAALVCLTSCGLGACGGSLAERLGRADRLLATSPTSTLAVVDALAGAGLASAGRRRLVERLARPWNRVSIEGAVARLRRHRWPLFEETMARVVRGFEAGVFKGIESTARRDLGLICVHFLLRHGAASRARRLLYGLPLSAGVAHLRAIVALAGGSREETLRALRIARARATGPLRDVATLNAARLAVAAGDLARGRWLYTRVSHASPWAVLAHEELAWLEIRARRPRRALAILKTLDRLSASPPGDRLLSEALALSDLGDPRARVVARQSRLLLTGAIKKGAIFLRRRSDVRLYYMEATAALAGVATVTAPKERGGGLPAVLQRALRIDPSFRMASDWVSQLQRERRLLARPEAKGLRLRLGLRLEARLVRAQTLAGETVRRLLARVIDELRELRGRTDELLVELDRRAERHALSPERGKNAGAATSSPRPSRASRGGQGRQRCAVSRETRPDNAPAQGGARHLQSGSRDPRCGEGPSSLPLSSFPSDPPHR